MDAVAATSPRSTVQDNIRTASYYHYLRENGLPLPEKPAKGYGSVAQDLHRANMDNLVQNGTWDAFKNPKPTSFSQNLQGNQSVATIDTHNFRLPGIMSGNPDFLATSVKSGTKGNRETVAAALARRYPNLPQEEIDHAVRLVPKRGEGAPNLANYRPQDWVKKGYITMEEAQQDPVLWATKPNANEYAHYEDWQRQQAAKMGISPAQYQAAMWLGGGEETGLGSAAEPFLRTFESRLKYTADRLGVPAKDVLDGLVRGKLPLLSVGGAVSAGALSTKHANQAHPGA